MDGCFMSSHHRQKPKKSKKTFDRWTSFFTLCFYYYSLREKMNTLTEPEWWRRQEEVITVIRAVNNSGNHWAVRLEHNGKEYPIPKEWISLHINGGAVRIHWIDITKQVQKWVENIFQHNSWNWGLKRTEPTNSDNTLLPRPVWSPES